MCFVLWMYDRSFSLDSWVRNKSKRMFVWTIIAHCRSRKSKKARLMWLCNEMIGVNEEFVILPIP